MCKGFTNGCDCKPCRNMQRYFKIMGYDRLTPRQKSDHDARVAATETTGSPPRFSIKCLTICQPYAELIAMREKRIENRQWPTGHRGPLIIHAGKSNEWLDPDYTTQYPNIDPPRMEFGAVVAVCRLAWVTDETRLHHARFTLADTRFDWAWEHEHREGPWYWILESIVRLDDAIPMRGQQGLYDVEPKIIKRIEKQLGPNIWNQLRDPACDADHARQKELFNGKA